MDRKNWNNNQRPFTLGGTPFAWQDMRIMKILREVYNERKLTTAIAIYQTFTDLASNEGRHQRKHMSTFPAYIITIAEKCGKSESTIKRYARDFRELGILSWETRRKGQKYLACMWKLHDYRGSLSEPTPSHNNELNTQDHNNALTTEENGINTINKKELFNKLNRNDGLKPIGDIMKRYGKNK